MKKKVILLYPYYKTKSGSYNRYLLLERLFKNIKIPVKLIILNQIDSNSEIIKILIRIIKFIRIEFLIFFYVIIKDYYFITDFNPSIIGLFSKKVIIQIHDLSWENINFKRHSMSLHKIFKFFIKNYSNILTVSKTSLKSLVKITNKKNKASYLYNSVNYEFIVSSNKIGRMKNPHQNNLFSKSINIKLPNIIYIATLSARKCHSDLLKALSETNSSLIVNLIGYPNDKNIEKIIRSNTYINCKQIRSYINYFPQLSQIDLCILLMYSSAYVSTSLDEGFGIPLLEAKLYGLPLIVRDIEINKELFPEANYFKTTKQLSKLLSVIRPLSEKDIQIRKKLLLEMNENNLVQNFNYSELSNSLTDLFQ